MLARAIEPIHKTGVAYLGGVPCLRGDTVGVSQER